MMKFECDSCHAQYMIADEKVGKRGVKVKCKRCQHVIIVRPGQAAPAEQKGAEKAAQQKPAVADDEGATEQVMRPVLPPDDDDAPDSENAPPTAILQRAKVPAEPEAGADAAADDTAGPGFAGLVTEPLARTAARDRAEPPPPPPLSEDAPATIGTSRPSQAALDAVAAALAEDELPADGPPPQSESRGDDLDARGRAAPATEISVRADALLHDVQQRGAADADPDAAERAPQSAAPAASARVEATVVTSQPAMSVGDPDARAADGDERTELGAPPQVSMPAPPVAAKGAGADALDDQLAGAFNAMFDGAAPGDAGDDEQRGPTRVLEAGDMAALRHAAGSSPAAAAGPPGNSLSDLQQELGVTLRARGADDGPAEPEWHIAIDDQDIGPLTLAEIGRHIEAGRADRDTLVWKIGMDDWLAAGQVDAVRALFDRVPMPQIRVADSQEGPPVVDRRSEAAKGSARAIGDGIQFGGDAAKAGGQGSPFDDDVSDGAWRPHGLTEVYQAANMAENAAGGGLAVGVGSAVAPAAQAKSSTGAGGSAGLASSADGEWRPGAASALASLVNDEIKRLESPAARISDLSGPPAADDASINGPVFGGELDAGAALGDGATMPQGQAPAPRGPTHAPSFGSAPAYATAPPQQARNPLIYVALGVGGLIVLLLIVVLAVVITREPQPTIAIGADGKPVLVGADGRPIVVNAAPVGAAAPAGGAVTPLPAAAAQPAPSAPAATDPTAAPVAPAAAAAAPAPAAEPPLAVAVAAPPAAAEPRAARNDTPRAKTQPKTPPVRAAAEDTPPSRPTKGCDPILDVDCKRESAAPRAADSNAKDTLTPADVLMVVKANKPKVEDCGKKNKVAGTVKMSWKILQNGKTSDVQVADSKFAGTPVGTCIAGQIKTWRFPAYSGKPVPPVTFPFKLGG